MLVLFAPSAGRRLLRFPGVGSLLLGCPCAAGGCGVTEQKGRQAWALLGCGTAALSCRPVVRAGGATPTRLSVNPCVARAVPLPLVPAVEGCGRRAAQVSVAGRAGAAPAWELPFSTLPCPRQALQEQISCGVLSACGFAIMAFSESLTLRSEWLVMPRG